MSLRILGNLEATGNAVTNNAGGVLYLLGDGLSEGDTRYLTTVDDSGDATVRLQRATVTVLVNADQVWVDMSTQTKDEMKIDMLVKAGLNSFQLANHHKMSSGGDTVYLSESIFASHKQALYSGFAGVQDDSADGVIPPTARVSGFTLHNINANGAAPVAASSTPMDRTDTSTTNSHNFGVTFILAEDVAQGTVLDYSVHQHTSDDEEIRVFNQVETMQEDALSGDTISVELSQPFDTSVGSLYHSTVHRNDTGELLNVRQGTDSLPYWLISLRTYRDKTVQTAAIDTIGASTIIHIGHTYTIPNPTPAVMLLVAAPIANTREGDSFTIFDPQGVLSIEDNANIVFDTGHFANLNTAHDNYTFFVHNNDWHYINNFNGKGGTV